MAEKASLAKLHVLQRKLETAQKRVMKVREIADDKVQHIVAATESAAVGFALGTYIGYKGGKGETSEVFGIPVALGAAVVLHAAGLFGVGGDMASHLHAFGNGALATAAADFGNQVGRGKANNLGWGESMKSALKEGGSPLGSKTIAGQRLSEDELAALARG